jgi:hypothetical protein
MLYSLPFPQNALGPIEKKAKKQEKRLTLGSEEANG